MAGLIHSRSRSVAGNNWLGKEYRTHALPSSSISSRAGAITPARACCGNCNRSGAVFQFPDRRHPAAIRTGTSTTWLHRWAMYSRMCPGPSWSGEQWKYCANYTPMLSEHGCERLSHDQPIVFSRRELWLTSRGASWQNAEQCAQRSAVADSLAQVAARFRKVKPNRERGAVSATAPKLV